MDSVIGGCPVAINYSFNVPTGLQSMNKALFAWMWWNNVGNREEYSALVTSLLALFIKMFTKRHARRWQ